MHTDIEEIKLGIINRFLLGGRVVAIRDNGICIGKNFHVYPIPSENLAFKTGLLIDTILWGEKKYRILRSKELRDALHNICKYRVEYWRPI